MSDMPRLLSFALFFGVALTLVGAVHYYIWARLVRDTMLPTPWQPVATAGIVGMYVLVPLSFFVRRAGASFAVPLVWVASVWMGLLLLFVVVRVGGALGRGGLGLWAGLGPAPPADPERRV